MGPSNGFLAIDTPYRDPVRVDPQTPRPSFSQWEPAIFIDDIPKLHAAADAAKATGAFYVEFRVRHADASVHWIAGKGEAAVEFGWERWIGRHGAFVGMHGFGASSPGEALFPHFGITAEKVAEAARLLL